MNAVRRFREITQNPEKIESMDLDEFIKSGNINIKIKNLTDEEKEDLSHLRINMTNGIMFDDRENETIATLH